MSARPSMTRLTIGSILSDKKENDRQQQAEEKHDEQHQLVLPADFRRIFGDALLKPGGIQGISHQGLAHCLAEQLFLETVDDYDDQRGQQQKPADQDDARRVEITDHLHPVKCHR